MDIQIKAVEVCLFSSDLLVEYSLFSALIEQINKLQIRAKVDSLVPVFLAH